ncbi:hypothetical protein CR513_58610, partial [Mucuna pruriens]
MVSNGMGFQELEIMFLLLHSLLRLFLERDKIKDDDIMALKEANTKCKHVEKLKKGIKDKHLKVQLDSNILDERSSGLIDDKISLM